MQEQLKSLDELLTELATLSDQNLIEEKISQCFQKLPKQIYINANNYYSNLNYHLYRYVHKLYVEKEEGVCMWRFMKNISSDQLSLKYEENPPLQLLDYLTKIYFYSDPLDDLTCLLFRSMNPIKSMII